MKSITTILITLVLILVSCDQFLSSDPSEELISANISNEATATPPMNPGALFERLWEGNDQWELVKPRPPGLGVSNEKAIHIYQIAPVFENDPLSPPIDVPGFISIGGRDHVIDFRSRQKNSFRAVAITVPILFPGWMPAPPFGAEQCVIPDLGTLNDRIAWRWVEVSAHPCGHVPMVYAVDFEDSGCQQPLTTVDRIKSAVDAGFAEFNYPPEEPWPFAIRPLTTPGQGKQSISAPQCI